MSIPPEHEEKPPDPEVGRMARMSTRMSDYSQRAEAASREHASVAVPFRAVRDNQRFAASALSGGMAYRLFFWLLPFSLIVGGALGLGNADSPEDALRNAGLPGIAVDSIGDTARAAGTSTWVLLVIGVPGLLWAGYTGTKAAVLITALIWNDPPERIRSYLRASLAFTGICVLMMALVGVTSWLRDSYWSVGLVTAVLTVLPLAGLWLWISIRLPHREVSWKMLIPGALLFSIGYDILHVLTAYVVLPKLEHSSSLYGAAGITSVYLFWRTSSAGSSLLRRS